MKTCSEKRVVGVFSPIHVSSPITRRIELVPFIPSNDSYLNNFASACHRFANQVPDFDGDVSFDFIAYFRCLTPLIWDESLTLVDSDVPEFVDWLRASNYTHSQKTDLQELQAFLDVILPSMFENTLFSKWESLDEPKVARGINAPHKLIKVLLGPLFHAIDAHTFKARYFVKGTDPRNWPVRMMELFEFHQVAQSDFKSMESHHHDFLSYAVYYWAMHMIHRLTKSRHLRGLIAYLMRGISTTHSKYMKISVDYRLMSGSMWTSSANSVLNFFLMSYLATSGMQFDSMTDRCVWVRDNFRGLFEGDDGIMLDYPIDKVIIKKLGLMLKIKHHENFMEAGFCSIYCLMPSAIVVKDPIKVLRKIFVLEPRFEHSRPHKQLSLLRARAMSLLVNFDQAPIISSLCHYILRITRSIDVRWVIGVLDLYQRHTLQVALEEHQGFARKAIPHEARVLVERMFNIPIHRQLLIEQSFDNSNDFVTSIDLEPWCSNDTLRHSIDFVTRRPKDWIPPLKDCITSFVDCDDKIIGRFVMPESNIRGVHSVKCKYRVRRFNMESHGELLHRM
jgi:hypothetical protein